MAWLLCDGRAVASLEVADSFAARWRGLLGRDSFEGAMLFPRTSSVHTLGMKFPIDVAYVDRDYFVFSTVTMTPWRVGLPRRKGFAVVEASAGAFERWGLARGSRLEVRP